ncbi:unnamed protein product [Durusdinium trenchii]|uniref:Uncharacterized protein n=1 Tax=Durusdinium trenchii TaxID=1381693 RepID=A0ABP0T009_9DINO
MAAEAWTPKKNAALPTETLEIAWSKLQDQPLARATAKPVAVWTQRKRPQSAPVARRPDSASSTRRAESPSPSELLKNPERRPRPTTADRFRRGGLQPGERGLRRSDTKSSLLSEASYHGTIDLTGDAVHSGRGGAQEWSGEEEPPIVRSAAPSRPQSAPSYRRTQTPPQLGAKEVSDWMRLGRSPWQPRKDANSVVTYKTSATSKATKRYLVRTDVPQAGGQEQLQSRTTQRQSARFMDYLWQVVTKPAEPMAQGEQPISQRQRAKNIRRNSKSGVKQVERPQRQEMQQQEETKARSRPSSAISRSVPVNPVLQLTDARAPPRQPSSDALMDMPAIQDVPALPLRRSQTSQSWTKGPASLEAFSQSLPVRPMSGKSVPRPSRPH